MTDKIGGIRGIFAKGDLPKNEHVSRVFETRRYLLKDAKILSVSFIRQVHVLSWMCLTQDTS